MLAFDSLGRNSQFFFVRRLGGAGAGSSVGLG